MDKEIIYDAVPMKWYEVFEPGVRGKRIKYDQEPDEYPEYEVLN